jgi:hypothetical protein
MGKSKNSPPSPNGPTPPTAAMEAQLATLNATLAQMAESQMQMCSRMEGIERSLHELKVENTAVREELASARREITKKDEIIASLQDQVNRIDQASRSRSVRILGLPITAETSAALVPKIVFDNVITPILNKAREVGDLPKDVAIPHHQFIIDEAFAIPTKKGSSCPVIVKFSFNSTRQLLFKHKKAVLPTFRDLSTNQVRSQYAVFEDLCPTTHSQFRAISSDHRVKNTWSFNGQIRFKLHDSETVYRVKSLKDTVDSVIKPQAAPSAMSP